MKYIIQVKKFTRIFVLWVIISIQSLAIPLALTQSYVNAEEIITETTTDSVASTTVIEEPALVVTDPVVQGPIEPTGVENRSYTLNNETGLWENDYYTWDPVTKITTPKSEQTYSYNPVTGRWDTTEWIYTPESGTYTPQTLSVPTNPVVENSGSLQNEAIQNSDIPLENIGSTRLLGAPTSTNSLSSNPYLNESSGSLSVTDYNSTNSGFYNGFFNANISVTVNSNARTGNASVLQNTIGGSALTGDASVNATIMNLVQSAWGVNGLMPYLYTENIQGNYFGDIFLDPGLLSVNNSSNTNDLIVNSTQDVAIVNDIDLKAESGNALVSSNTEAGDAVTGDATAILNLMNFINSTMSTGQSFIGMLNIFGNLEGDVLLPDNMLDSLLASNIPTTEIQIQNTDDTSLIIENINNQTINNNINATALTGNAVVDSNTYAGDAKTGDANTSVTVFNLTGSQVVAERAMLVFVQVMGKWVGFITNAPSGSNVALLGGGVDSNNNYGSTSAEFNNKTDSLIDNNVNINAITGNANVSENTSAGSAITGDANAIANITNISNSSFNLSNWFGMLFINVFGDWNGSFGTNTPFGSIISAVNSSNEVKQTQAVNKTDDVELFGAEPNNQNVRVFAVTIGSNSSGGTSVTSATPVMEEDVPPPTVLYDTDEKDKFAAIGNSSDDNPTNGLASLFWVSIISVMIAAFIYKRVQLST